VPQLFDHPYAPFLHRVEKPTRYTGSEFGVRRKDWGSVEARVCLAFPDVYDIGMSHLGYRMLYKILNDDTRLLAERCYAPWRDMIRELEQHGEFVRSLETARPLCDFDVVGFSLQFELTFTNVLLMLDFGSIPRRSAARSDGDPLVIAGGPVATHAEPMADFFDVIAIGDGEELCREIALCWVDGKRRGLNRERRLRELAQLEGAYVPSLYTTARDERGGFEVVTGSRFPEARFPLSRRLLDDIDRFPFPDDGPVGGPEAIFDRMSIEVTRGCTEGCRFCQAGMIYRPVRERDPAQIIETVERALKNSGQDQVSLTALSTADVSCISPLIKNLVERTAPERVSLSVASLRAYGLAEDLLDDMRRVRASGLTFAPEAGTQRMRDVINKNVTEEQLMETAERVFSRGFDKMKLYFMIGLPTETDEDVLGIINVGRNAMSVGNRLRKGRANVTVSVSTHVPKPHTPFQWCAMDSLEEIRRKQDLLKSEVRTARGVLLRTHSSVTSVLEGVLARGDRPLSAVVERAYDNGARFDSWDECLNLKAWEEAFQHFQVDRGRYLGTIPVDARLPWDHFDLGLEEGFLLREYRKAVKSRLSPPCGKARGMFIHHTNVEDAKADTRKLVCYDCGIACDMGAMQATRISFLEALGADAPQTRVRLPLAPTQTSSARRRQFPEELRPARPGGIPERFRLRFEKTGATAMLGHLDLLRELPRVVRRAGARTQYSKGFHPLPEISFGPALSLGVASLDEYLEVKLIDAVADEAFLASLNRAAGEGLRFTEIQRIADREPRINSLITGAEYLLCLSQKDLPGASIQTVEDRIRAFLEQSDVSVTRQFKGTSKRINVRKFVRHLQLARDASDEIRRAGVVGVSLALRVEVAILPEGAAKTSEVVAALFAQEGVPHRAIRTRLIVGMPNTPQPPDIGEPMANISIEATAM
jgi:radical SAM family uncharacterized protein/radical SAM-linked protein